MVEPHQRCKHHLTPPSSMKKMSMSGGRRFSRRRAPVSSR